MDTAAHVYELRLRGSASELTTAAFADLDVSVGGEETVLRTHMIDSAALYELLSQVESLGNLELTDLAALDWLEDRESADDRDD